jgi:uncharacterized glyoxalase superfamily protein PhnB
MELFGFCLITADVRRLADFYRLVLASGVEAAAAPAGDEVHVEIAVPGASLAIYSEAAAVRDMGFSFPAGSGRGYAALMVRVADVDAEYARLKAAGVAFMTEPKTYPWGARSVHFRDPDGNIVDLVAPPPGR